MFLHMMLKRLTTGGVVGVENAVNGMFNSDCGRWFFKSQWLIKDFLCGKYVRNV